MIAPTLSAAQTSVLPASMDAAAQSLLAGAPAFALHLALTLGILIAGIAIYVLLTPHKELKLIRDGNAAAALSMGAITLGLAIPLATSMRTSLSWADLLIWGVVTLLVQLLVFRVVDMLLPGLARRIASNDMAAAILLAAAKLSTALILSAAVDGAPLERF